MHGEVDFPGFPLVAGFAQERAFGVQSDDFLEALLGRVAAGTFEEDAKGAGDFGALLQPRYVSLRVLLEVEPDSVATRRRQRRPGARQPSRGDYR